MQNATLKDESQAKLEKDSVLLHLEIKEWWVTYVMKPLEDFCVRNHISPNVITLWALGCSFLCFLLFATGHFLSAGWVVLLAGSLDFLDGRVARATNRVTNQGAYFDSVLDRYQDFFIFAGLAVFYRNSPVFFLVLLTLLGSEVVPYAKARAEGFGISLSGVGAMQRPERVFSIGFGSMVSSVFQVSLMPFYGKGNPPAQHILILVLIFLAVSTNLTAIKRIRYTMRHLAKEEEKS